VLVLFGIIQGWPWKGTLKLCLLLPHSAVGGWTLMAFSQTGQPHHATEKLKLIKDVYFECMSFRNTD